MLALLASAAGTGAAGEVAAGGAAAGGTWAARDAATFLVSGHSLTDDPYAQYIADLAAGFGLKAQWNQQIAIGSPIRIRTQGRPGGPPWNGYRHGKNRRGSDLDLLAEIASPKTVDGRYDTLVITETIDIVADLQFNNTVRLLRHYHDRLVAANPTGRTFFFHGWARHSAPPDAAAWVAHEREMLPTWRTAAARINHSLAAEGRPDRIVDLPAAMALAELVHRATTGTVDGITQSDAGGTLGVLFSDHVHLRRVGVYYVACVSFAALYGRSPVGGVHPREVSGAQAASLQSIAWDVISSYYRRTPPMSLAEAQAQMAGPACPVYWQHAGKPQNANFCRTTFASKAAANPFHYDAASDAGYWFPAP